MPNYKTNRVTFQRVIVTKHDMNDIQPIQQFAMAYETGKPVCDAIEQDVRDTCGVDDEQEEFRELILEVQDSFEEINLLGNSSSAPGGAAIVDTLVIPLSTGVTYHLRLIDIEVNQMITLV